jgi:hypothetical protein
LRLALRPTILARERFYADTRASATRQRTLEANRIDCGAGPFSTRARLTRRAEGVMWLEDSGLATVFGWLLALGIVAWAVGSSLRD